MKKIALKMELVDTYYSSITEEQWSKSTIKNKLAYLKRKGKYEDQLALQCANKKFLLEQVL